jgi:polysaccharide biosynthesis transport protein
MTTLPQTTPVRVPPGLGPGLNFPLPGAPAGIPMPAVGMTGADAWRVIRANLWLIILLLIVSAAAGYGAHRLLLKYHARFTSSGLLEIGTRQWMNLVENQVSDMTDSRVLVELRTQAQRLQSETLFAAVLRKPDGRIRETAWFRQFEQPGILTGNATPATRAKEDLLDRFRVSPIPDSKLLSVSMTAATPNDSRVVMEEIVEEFLRQDREAAAEAYDNQIRSLRRISEEFKTDLAAISRQIEQQQAMLSMRGMPLGRGMAGVREIELSAIMRNRLEAQKDRGEAAMALRSAEEQLQGGEHLSRVEEFIEAEPTMLALSRQVLEALISRDIQRDRVGTEHQNFRQAERQLEVFRQQQDLRRDELRARYRKQYIEGVRGRFAQAAAAVKELQDEEKRLRDEMGELNKELAELLVRMDTASSMRNERIAVDNKIRDLIAVANLQGSARIRWAARPETPEVPSFPRLKVVMPLAIFIGLALGLAIAFLREFLNDTVRSPRDIARVGQMTLLGLICDQADDPQAADARLAIFDAPHSMTAEQFRQMRTRLNQAASLDTIRSLMISGPSALDGKTTVAANLAAGLALNGRRILLVDANFRRPELHRLFGASNQGGFAEVLTGQAALDQRVHATRIPNLAVLPSGPKPANVTELFESQLFTDFVENALQAYDHVIFDSGPLLVVSESAAMAPRVDGVITVVRAHAESRGLLQRMRDSLRQLKAEHVGVVLNAVRAQGGGYYGRNIKAYYQYQSEA